MISKPQLEDHHKVARLEWAKKYMSFDIEWSRDIFSDEKKFNLDGPDGFHSYWHDIRKEEKQLMSRQHGGGCVMIWGAFSMDGKTPLAIVNRNMNSTKYCNQLEAHLLPFGEKLGGPNWIFQQDNASIHASKETTAWFSNKNVNIMKWPAQSSDLNPIENL